jgi:hypothetical protein
MKLNLSLLLITEDSTTSSPPQSPIPDRKRKYDWTEHQNAPERPILFARPPL